MRKTRFIVLATSPHKFAHSPISAVNKGIATRRRIRRRRPSSRTRGGSMHLKKVSLVAAAAGKLRKSALTFLLWFGSRRPF